MLPRTASKFGCFFLVTALVAWLSSCGSGETPSATSENQEEQAQELALAPPAKAQPDASAGVDVSSRGGSDATGDATPAEDDASFTPVAETPRALGVLASLRARFKVKVPPDPRDEDPANSGNPNPGRPDGGFGAEVTASVLGNGKANRFEKGPDGVIPSFSAEVEARPARVKLAKTATAPFRIEDAATGMAVEVTLRDSVDAPGEAAQGYLVYSNGHASGATLLHRALADGIEDYWSFDQRPATPTVAYDVALGQGVRGLRLVANTLEMLDGEGTPRLRVSPPTLMGANGAIVEASLSLDNCAYDEDPAPPWARAVVAPGAESCTVRVIWPEEQLVYPALLDPKWSTTGSMSRKRRDHTATLLSNGKVLVAGGNDGYYVFSSAELYDRTTGTWSSTGSMSGARMLHTATQLGTSSNATTSGKVLVAGGYNGSSTLNTAQLYSPTAGTWIAAANLNASRKDHTATLLANGKVLVAGGASGSTTLNTAAIYNPASGAGSWTAVGNMATARKYHTATLLVTSNATLNNKVLVVGGRSSSAILTSVQLFDGNSSWTTLTSLSSAREQHTATVVANGKVLIAGGKSGSSTLATTQVFNPASGSGSWTSGGNMTSPRHGHTATLLSSSVQNNGQVLVAGGWNGSAVVSSAELWNGASTWTLTTPLPAPVKYQTDTLLSNGMVLIAGGVDADVDPVSKAYLYDPSRGSPCTTATECASGFCANGVCCDSACNDECGACNLTGMAGTCSPKANGTACADEGNPCTVDRCNGASLNCQHPAGNAGAICRPAATVCDLAESCTGASTSCPVDSKAPDGTACNDGNACTTVDQCASGTCVGGAPPVIDDGNPCTADSCQAGTGPVHDPLPAGTSCEDSTICNGVETCDGEGRCMAGVPPFIDDGLPCTIDTCDATGIHHTQQPVGTSCGDLCTGAGTCDAAGECVGGTPVTCTALDQCHAVGVCDPATGICSDPPLPDGTACEDGLSCTQGDTCQAGVCVVQTHACTPDCPCDSGATCTTDTECQPGLVCGQRNGRYFGKDPMSSNCWPPGCTEEPYYLGCGQTSWPCGLCPPAPPRICTSNTDCQSTNEVCGSGNGVAFGLGNVNVCWPPTCSAGDQALCGSPNLPCGNCSCATTCNSKTCSTPDKSDGCGGYCTGLCGDGQTGCSTNADCRGNAICLEGTCLPPSCVALDPSRNCPGSAAACGSCPDCDSLCAAEDRECGPAPAGCPGGCGTCGGGQMCVDGKCRAPTTPPEPIEPTTPVGALEGSFSVTDGGQAQYRIPIALPPGRTGLQPDIGLVYTSDKKLSPQGIGWRLTGFSQIARCSTRAGNEPPRPVQYNDGDRFCIDGKRMIALADGTYRTEVDQFSKIVVTALNALGEPASFKVYTKAGTIFTFGDTESSRVFHVLYAPYRVMTRAWAISRVEDRNGNTMHFSYESRRFYIPPGRKGDTLEMVPKEVSYGGNTVANLGNDRGVRFNYTDIGIRAQHFVNGGEATMQQRLDTIETYARGSQVIRRYGLDYESKGNVLRLTTAKECAIDTTGQEVCKPETTFSYYNGNQDTALDSSTKKPDASHAKKLAYWRGFSMANADGTDQWWLKGTIVGAGAPPQPFGREVDGSAIDVDNDGADEFLSTNVSANTLKINGLAVPFTAPWEATRAVATDIDGDGLKDVLVWNLSSSIWSHGRLGYLKGGTLTGTPEFHDLPPRGNGEHEPMLIDVDDDGVVNWVRVVTPQPFTLPPAPPSWQYLVLSDPTTGLPAWKPLSFNGESTPGGVAKFTKLDANGDGLVDLLQIALPAPGAMTTVWLNQGDGSFRRSESEAPPPDPENDPSGLVFDFNGDGADDFVMEHRWIHWNPSTLRPQVGTGVFDPIIRFNLFDGGADTHFAAFLADENGDGDLDVIDGDGPVGCLNNVNCPPKIRYGSSRRIHLLTGVVDGVRRKISVDYDGNRKVSRTSTCAGRTDLLCPTKFAPLVGAHHFSTISPQGVERKRKSFDYSYADARAGTQGRGSYGFGGRTIKEYEFVDGQSVPYLFSTTDLTYYNDDFALAGLLKSRTVSTGQLSQAVPDFVQPSRRVVEERRTYEKRQNAIVTPADAALSVVFPVLSQSTTRIFDDVPDVGRQIVSTEVTDFVIESIYDGYDDRGNNLYEIRRAYSGDIAGDPQASTVTNRHYKPIDIDNWLIGLIESMDVTDRRSGVQETRNWRYDYYPDGSGRLLQRTRDPGGASQQVEKFFYDDPAQNAFNLTRHVLQPGDRNRTTTIAYDDSVTFPSVTRNARNQPTTTVYDPRNGALVRTIDPNGLTETRSYDAFGRLTKVRGPSRTTRFRIKVGNAEELPYPSPDPGAVMRVITEEVSTSGQVGAMKVEDFGPFGEILKRDVAGYQTRPTVEQPLVTEQWVEENFSYDPAGRLLVQTRPHLPGMGATDNQGQLEFKYDPTGQLTEEIYPDENGTTTSVYHATATRNTWLNNPEDYFLGLGVAVEVVTKRVHTTPVANDAFEQASIRIMDPEGLVVSARDPGQHFTDYFYGPFRQLTSVDVGRDRGVTTFIEYYPYGRKRRHSDPDTGVENYEVYNEFDELTSMTDARGINRTYDYDELGRLKIAQAYITGLPEADETTQWDYDGIQGETGFNEVGRLVRVRSGPAGDAERFQTRYHYQQGSTGLLESVDRTISNELFSTGFTYEGEFNRISSVDYPSAGGAFGVHRSYDQRGNLIAVSDGVDEHSPYWQVTEASQGYRIASETFGNNAVTTTKYEPFTGRLSRLKTVSAAGDNGVELQGFEYAYSPNGNLEVRTNTTTPRTDYFGYDELDRLTGIGHDAPPVQVAAYDLHGNITSKADVGTYDYTAAGGWQPAHAPRKIQNGSTTRTFFYDPSGNEIERNGGSEGRRATEYTSFNLPLSIADSATGLTTTFEYDGDQARVLKVESGSAGQVQTLYAGNIYERITDNTTGTPVVRHKYRIFAVGKQVAQLERSEGASATVYLHGDHLGSTQVVTPETPVTTSDPRVHRQLFDPWGQAEGTATWDDAAPEGVRNVHTGFTGHEHDPGYRLINMRGRIYDPELGRFTTADPIVQAPFDSQSFNRYAYVFNNPLKYVDPSGFAVISPHNPKTPDAGGGGKGDPSKGGQQGSPGGDQTAPSGAPNVPDSSTPGAGPPGGTASGPKQEGPGGGGTDGPQTGPGGGEEPTHFGDPTRPGARESAQGDVDSTWKGGGDPKGGTPGEGGAYNPAGRASGAGRRGEARLPSAAGRSSRPDPSLMGHPAAIAGQVIVRLLALAAGAVITAASQPSVQKLWKDITWTTKTPQFPAGPYPDYPGDDPTKPPPGYTEWVGPDAPGGEKGAWVNPETGESLHPDVNHGEPVGPHWDWNTPNEQVKRWRIFKDGKVEPLK